MMAKAKTDYGYSVHERGQVCLVWKCLDIYSVGLVLTEGNESLPFGMLRKWGAADG